MSKVNCIECGATITGTLAWREQKEGLPLLCGTCRRHKEHEEYVAKKFLLFNNRKCEICGKPVPWHESYAKRNPKYYPTTCSKECASKLCGTKTRVSKEIIEKRVLDYIKNKGTYATYAEVTKACHTTAAQLGHYGLSVAALNKQALGLTASDLDAVATRALDIQVLNLEELCEAYHLKATTYQEAVKEYFKSRSVLYCHLTYSFMTDLLLGYIQSQGHYMGIAHLCEELKMGRDHLNNYGIDVPAINRMLGYKPYSGDSYFEAVAYTHILKYVPIEAVSRWHVFPDCRSTIGRPLEFDFYIPSKQLLIEIDGSLHYKDTNKFGTYESTSANDQVKNAYAKQCGYTLIRIDTTPKNTFVDRLEEAVSGIFKPVELLEPQTDNAEGNQQPSLETESIQDEFDF